MIESLRTKMEHAIETSHYKYGEARKTYPELAQAHKCIIERLDYYENGRKTRDVAPHNKDYLVDVANFAMLEAMFPAKVRVHPVSPDARSGWRGDFSTRFIETVKDLDGVFAATFADSGKTKVEEIKFATAKYLDTGDATLLEYIAWLAAEEFFAPTFEDSFYDINVAGANLSPGLADGISHKQLMEGEWK